MLAPVTPRKLICVGGNYRDHLEESGVPVPAAPILFAKLSSAVIGPYDPIVLPRQEAAPDFEAEVGVVMGRWLRNADESIARAAIGGFIAINDVTGRAAQQDDGQWMRGKSFDTLCADRTMYRLARARRSSEYLTAVSAIRRANAGILYCQPCASYRRSH